jgi:hypothetical protein
MIVCPECGTRNPAGTQFCGECGTFLEWSEQEPAAVSNTSPANSAPSTSASSTSASSTSASSNSATVNSSSNRGGTAVAEPTSPAVPADTPDTRPVENNKKDDIPGTTVQQEAENWPTPPGHTPGRTGNRADNRSGGRADKTDKKPDGRAGSRAGGADKPGGAGKADERAGSTAENRADSGTGSADTRDRERDKDQWDRGRDKDQWDRGRDKDQWDRGRDKDQWDRGRGREQGDRTDPARADGSGTPRLVQPGERQQRYISTADEPDTLAPGEIACRNCGAGNLATRKFCRACGNSLAASVVVERRSWWQRFLDWLFRRRKHEAGTRRVMRDSGRWLRPLIAVLGVVALVIGAFTIFPTRSYLNKLVTGLQDRSSKHQPVRPDRVSASSSRKEGPPDNLFDTVSNRFWAPSKGPEGQWVEAHFPEPVRLLDIIVTSGISQEQDVWVTQGRPAQLEVTFVDNENKETKSPIMLADKPGEQAFKVEADKVVKVRIAIISTYGMTEKKGLKCAIGELEFFKRG